MPRSVLFTKEQIIESALDLTRERGFSAVTARAIGARLGTSSQPIFGYFDSMSDVREAVIRAAYDRYLAALKAEMGSDRYPPYKASGMAYIHFAREEPELFRLLFMRDRTPEEKAAIDGDAEMLADLISRQIGITRERARLFHLEMWAYVHGIATMIVTNYYDWCEELCNQTLTDMYQGLQYKYKDQK